jgi:hypothetical protein
MCVMAHTVTTIHYLSTTTCGHAAYILSGFTIFMLKEMTISGILSGCVTLRLGIKEVCGDVTVYEIKQYNWSHPPW